MVLIFSSDSDVSAPAIWILHYNSNGITIGLEIAFQNFERKFSSFDWSDQT